MTDETDALAKLFDSDRDRNEGDVPETDLEDGQSEQKASDEQEGGKPAPVEEKPVDEPSDGHRVPYAEMKAEREKRQSEARAREEAEQRAAAYQQQLSQLQAQMQAANQQQQQPAVPDFYEDPEGFYAYQQYAIEQAIAQNEQRMQLRMLNSIAEMSKGHAVTQHGSDVVQAAEQAAIRSGLNHHFLTKPDPYRALMDWHNSQQVFQELGGDPAKWRDAERQKIRAEVMAEMKGGPPPQQQSFPGTLATATAQGDQGAHLNPDQAIGALFDTDRDRRQ